MSAGGFANKIRRGVAVALTLITLGVIALWVDSYRVRPAVPDDEWDFNFTKIGSRFGAMRDVSEHPGLWLTFIGVGEGSPFVETCRGELRVGIETDRSSTTRPTPIQWEFGGFGYSVKSVRAWGFRGVVRTIVSRTGFMPFWAMVVLFAIYPGVYFAHGPINRWRRRMRGQCLDCGYSMTGNVSGACPECGATVEVRA